MSERNRYDRLCECIDHLKRCSVVPVETEKRVRIDPDVKRAQEQIIAEREARPSHHDRRRL